MVGGIPETVTEGKMVFRQKTESDENEDRNTAVTINEFWECESGRQGDYIPPCQK